MNNILMKKITVTITVDIPKEIAWEYWNDLKHIPHWSFATPEWGAESLWINITPLARNERKIPLQTKNSPARHPACGGKYYISEYLSPIHSSLSKSGCLLLIARCRTRHIPTSALPDIVYQVADIGKDERRLRR